MYKCCACKKEFEDDVQDLCECGGGVVEYHDDYHEAWADDYRDDF